MNRHQAARKVLALIYERTSIEAPEFDPDALLHQIRMRFAFPRGFMPDTTNQTVFIQSLEREAHVLNLEELRSCAKIAESIEAFRYKMQRYFADGQLPVEWALLFKKFKDDGQHLELLRDRLKNLDSETSATP